MMSLPPGATAEERRFLPEIARMKQQKYRGTACQPNFCGTGARLWTSYSAGYVVTGRVPCTVPPCCTLRYFKVPKEETIASGPRHGRVNIRDVIPPQEDQ